MAPMSKKRAHDGIIDLPRKKLKANDRIRDSSIHDHDSQVVSLDSVHWHKVPFPENFQDAEGFFGLEELSDVDVVKESGKGLLDSKLPKHKTKTITREPEGRTKNGTQGSKSGQVRATVESEGEWEGLEASESEEQRELEIPSQRQRGATPPSQTLRNTPLKSSVNNSEVKSQHLFSQRPRNGQGNIFDVLGADDEDEYSERDVSAWDFLNLSPETLSALAHFKFIKPTPIQTAALPHILAGHDAICKAPTGSGKTLTFGIPICEYYYKSLQSTPGIAEVDKPPENSPFALILAPTRELARQLTNHLIRLGSASETNSPAIETVTGGLSIQKQQRRVAGADIVIGTPGRLWEIMQNSSDLTESLKSVKFLVLDEADRLFSSGHFQEMDEILNALDRSNDDDGFGAENLQTQRRQTLVFSATLQKDLQQKLAGKSKSSRGDPTKEQSMEYLLKRLNFQDSKPKFIDVNPVSQMATGLKEGVVECAGTEKDLYLYSLLLHHPHTLTLIFTNSITSVRRLTLLLQNLSLPAHALHSQMPMKSRLRSIERFSTPSTPSILVATDVAARGLDIPAVQLVIHYHLPRTADMYVHRSGRTARASMSGSSILLCSPEETQGVRRLVAKVHVRGDSAAAADKKIPYMRTLDLDRHLTSRLKPRLTLSKKISDHALASEKQHHETNWLKSAAEDLGVEYDSEDFAAAEGNKKRRGAGRKKREKEARGLSREEVAGMRRELKALLGTRVNVGVSERYLSAGGLDVDELLGEGEGKNGEFLGRVEGGSLGL
ncbi:ATP-dependent RNA helicase [Lecanora helva]